MTTGCLNIEFCRLNVKIDGLFYKIDHKVLVQVLSVRRDRNMDEEKEIMLRVYVTQTF